MKAQPAVFFGKGVAALFLVAMPATGVGAQQGYVSPAAIQTPASYPANYRQPGSAYRPPGINAPQAPVHQQAAPATRQTTSPAPRGYQPGFGTPPPSYKPPGLKPTSAPAPAKTSKSSAKKSPSNLESKVARLERNDAQQDRRLNRLEGKPEEATPAAGSSGEVYVVRSGDTLWRIADKYSTSINALKSANRLSGDTIAVGQALHIPGAGGGSSGGTATVPAIASAEFTGDTSSAYIVRPGDNFNQIAQNHGITPDELAKANRTAYPDRLLPGERLIIPGKSTGQPAPAARPGIAAAAMTSSPSRSHTVKKGESLMGIARTYGVTTATLVSANKLKNANVIRLGQQLLIPGQKSILPASPQPAPASAPSYPGLGDPDTQPLAGASLASSTPAPVTAPAAPLPPLTSSLTETASTSAKTPPQSSNSRGIVAYRMEKGDDISTVAALFNTTPEKIRELNKLPSGQKLREGDELVVPSLGAVSLN